jgi:hypothetical protein
VVPQKPEVAMLKELHIVVVVERVVDACGHCFLHHCCYVILYFGLSLADEMTSNVMMVHQILPEIPEIQ